MIYPDIKTYRENLRDHYIAPLTDRPHFLGRNALDVRWKLSHPAVNIKREGHLFELEIAMPGFAKEEIKIIIENDILSVRGKKEHLEKKETSEYILQEFESGLLERKFRLAEGLGREDIEAKYENGILKLVFTDVPPEEEKDARSIEIK